MGINFRRQIKMNSFHSCLNCDKREIGCHATCEDYNKEKAEWEALREKIRQSKDKKQEYDKYICYKHYKRR